MLRALSCALRGAAVHEGAFHYMLRRSLKIEAGSEAEQALAEKLKQAFPASKHILVQDTSGGCGAMYTIMVEAEEFKSMSLVKQHQAVHRVLKEDIAKWHGLNLTTRPPQK